MIDTSLAAYRQDLAIKGYSPKTQKTYFACVRKFVAASGKSPAALAKDDVKAHLARIIDSGKCSVSTMNQNYSALKYFFRATLEKPWELEGIPRVKKHTQLPAILSKEEALAVIRHAANVKHRAMLALVYGSGLRVSEIPKLTPADIVRDKLRVKITQGKGAKDRYAILSQRCLDYLGYYWRTYRPQGSLFEGRVRGKPISARACQHAFAIAKKNAGIAKKCGIHSLRHSFATHFLEAGGGIFQLQKFLGHKKIKTTLVYCQFQEERAIARSPLDVYAGQDVLDR
jgi:integrase/recombinase XerD